MPPEPEENPRKGEEVIRDLKYAESTGKRTKKGLLDVAIKRPLTTMKRTVPVISLCSYVIGPGFKHM